MSNSFTRKYFSVNNNDIGLHHIFFKNIIFKNFHVDRSKPYSCYISRTIVKMLISGTAVSVFMSACLITFYSFVDATLIASISTVTAKLEWTSSYFTIDYQ